jgi:hypothetical protein
MFLLDSESRMRRDDQPAYRPIGEAPSCGRADLAGRRVCRLAVAHRIPLDAMPDLGDTQVIVYSTWDRSPTSSKIR